MNKRLANARGTHGATKNVGPGNLKYKLNRSIKIALARKARDHAEAERIAKEKRSRPKVEKPKFRTRARKFFQRTFNKGQRGK